MSIATAITNAQGKVADAYTAVSNKGGTLPATQNLSNLPTAILSIQAGKTSVTFTRPTGGHKIYISSSGESSQTSENLLNRTADYTGDLNSTYYVVEQGSIFYNPVFSITFA